MNHKFNAWYNFATSLIVPAYFVQWLALTLSMKQCYRLLVKMFERGWSEVLTAMLLEFQVVCSVTLCWSVIFRDFSFSDISCWGHLAVVTCKWVWSIVGMKLTGGKPNSLIKRNCPTAVLFTWSPTGTGLALNPGPHGWDHQLMAWNMV